MTCFIKDNKFLIINNQNIARALKNNNKLNSIKLQWFVFIIMLIHSSLYSQIGGLLPTKKEMIEDNDYLSKNRYVPTETILENTIDPREYIIGPGDEFAFNMLSSNGIVSLVLKITPTGEVLIPAVGVIFIDKMTLVDAFKKIKTMCLEKYSNAKINLTLVKIRLLNFKIST